MAVAKNIISNELADLFLELDDDISTLDTNREPSGNTDLEGRERNKAISALLEIFLLALKRTSTSWSVCKERIIFQFF